MILAISTAVFIGLSLERTWIKLTRLDQWLEAYEDEGVEERVLANHSLRRQSNGGQSAGRDVAKPVARA